jgi:hypothetical protein
MNKYVKWLDIHKHTCKITAPHTVYKNKCQYARCEQKIPRLIFRSAVSTLRDTRGQTVNQQFYLQVLKRLTLAVSRKRPQKRAAGVWALHHDNAPAHTAHSIQSRHSCRSATTLLPWHGFAWLLVVPPIKNSVEREEIWRHWRNSEECDKYATHHSKILFQKMFSAVTGPLEAVCQLTRRVFWKLLNIFSH